MSETQIEIRLKGQIFDGGELDGIDVNLEMEAMPGTYISNAIMATCHMAKALKQIVMLTFNAVELKIGPETTLEQATDYYMEQQEDSDDG
jgi:hypothetical protein